MLGHVYGGGVCNLNPNDVKAISVLDPSKLDSHGRQQLAEAYSRFLATNGQVQPVLDQVIFELLGLEREAQTQLYKALGELRGLSLALKTSAAEDQSIDATVNREPESEDRLLAQSAELKQLVERVKTACRAKETSPRPADSSAPQSS
jgi:hypothetical protein